MADGQGFESAVKVVSEQTAERSAEERPQGHKAEGSKSEGRQTEWTNVRDKLLIEVLKTVLPSGNR
jgi:hypothetical protein